MYIHIHIQKLRITELIRNGLDHFELCGTIF
jgi:hypothetical protein